MHGGIIVEEEYIDQHHRVVKIDDGKTRIYSIDYYQLLPSKPKHCINTLVLNSIELCYVDLGKHCSAVVLVSSDRVELVNLRLKVSIDKDPAGGSMSEARNICLEHVDKVASVG